MAREYTPITVVYKKERGRKLFIKEFTNLPCPDPILGKKSSKYLPLGCELIELGVGTKFYNIYKKKHKL